MKISRVSALAVLLLAGSLPVVAAPAAVPRGTEVLISADAIPSTEGFRPKPGKPITYALRQTTVNMGEIIAGVKLPPPAGVEQAIVAELAKQGFVRAEKGGSTPDIYILAVFGSANFGEPSFDVRDPLSDPEIARYLDQVDVTQVMVKRGLVPPSVNGSGVTRLSIEQLFSGGSSEELDLADIREAVLQEALRLREKDSPRAKDKGTIESMVGADKLNRAFKEKTIDLAEAQRFAAASQEDRYFVALTAFDAERFQKKEMRLLWKTVVTIDYRSDFTKSLTAMLTQAGPLFGTDLPLPVFLDERDRLKADVKVGDIQVLSDKADASKPKEKK